jgi:3-oxoacyl-[acyl-carrier-protein] synthase II
MEEVVITGMGCVSALGNSPDILWDNLLQGKSGIAKIDRFDVSALPVQIAAAVKEFDGSEFSATETSPGSRSASSMRSIPPSRP